jgi:ABC-2 type transport system permease protein
VDVGARAGGLLALSAIRREVMMFWIILQKTLREGFTSFTLLSALSIVTLLVPLVAYTQARYYQRVRADYFLRQNIHQAERSHQSVVLNRPVPDLLPFFNGVFDNLPVEIALSSESAFGNPSSEDLVPLERLFPGIDLSLVIGVVLTLMAVILPHDTVVGDRERGTLKLILSGPVSRRTVILAKMVGEVLLVALSLIYAMLLYITIVFAFSNGTLDLSGSRLLELAVYALTSLLTLMAFAALGFAVSSSVTSSSLALSASITIWVAAVLIWPSLGLYVGFSAWPVSLGQADQRQMLLKESELIQAELIEHEKMALDLKARNAGVESAWHRYLEVRREWTERKREEIERLVEEQSSEVWRRQAAIRHILSISPYGAFKEVLGNVCGTGFEEYESFLESARRYDKDVFMPASFKYLENSKPWVRRASGSEEFQIQHFQHVKPSLARRLEDSAGPLSLIIVEILLLGTFALWKFERLDVR